MKRIAGVIIFSVLFLPMTALAHHGGVSLPFGPGTPIETNSPLTLPEGGFVLSTRFERAEWRQFQFAEPANITSFTFMNVGLSYGVKPYLTTSIFVPYAIKREETYGDNQGIGDIRFSFILGFNHDGEGFSLNSAKTTAVSLEKGLEKRRKTFFSFYGGFTLPTGKTNLELGGVAVPVMQPGFGSPSYTVGFNAARSLFGSFTLVFDTGYDIFTERMDSFKFGNEWRVNLAGVQELLGKPEGFLSKLDAILELNFLNLARDQLHGEGQNASGGNVLYLSPGLRFAFPKLQYANLGLLVKFPIYTNLNEQSEQQGAEGLEKYRAILTLSFYF